MSKLSIFVSGTIVLFFCHLLICDVSAASPQPDAPENHEKQQSWSDNPPDENMAISKPPKPGDTSGRPTSRYYPYRQELTFRTGVGANLSSIDKQHQVIGFQYMFPKFLSPKLEAGADLHEEGKGHVHAGVRWIWWERSGLRPSLKAALDCLVNSKQQLATFSKFGNYYARGGAAVEYTIANPYSVRLETELLASVEDVKTVVTIGLNYGW